VTLALFCAVQTAPAQARVAPAPSAVPTRTSLSIPGVVCSLAKFPVKTAATKLISLMAKENVAVLSASLLTTLGEPWCEKKVSKLKPVFKQAVALKPALRPRIGPFLFNVLAGIVAQNQKYDWATVRWTEFDLTSRLRFFYVWCRVNGGRWIHVHRTVALPRGSNVQFAVRIDNIEGISSPWAYTPVYYMN
jgi:hypothetical protein